jgi:glycosyltransferase involved in cell wall biosynthesis
MHIAIDARELAGRATGAGRYLAQLLAQWAALAAGRSHRYTLIAHTPLAFERGTADVSVIVEPGSGGTRWEQITLPAVLRRLAPDVLFAPAYTAPLFTRVPVVLAVHDVSFLAHPEWFRAREAWRRRLITRAAARRARLVLTLSAFSRNELVRHAGISGDRIRVTPLGLGFVPDGGFPPHPIHASDSPLILFVGSVFNRRHVPSLIRALAAVRAKYPQARLTIVGENRTWPHQDLGLIAAEAGVTDGVTQTAYVDDEALHGLYARASVFAFLSEYEGFGLTPLEALAHGVPAVVLDTAVAREVYGPAVEYVPTTEPQQIAATILRLLDDPEYRQARIAHVPAVLGRYRWRDAAATVLTALEQAVVP